MLNLLSEGGLLAGCVIAIIAYGRRWIVPWAAYAEVQSIRDDWKKTAETNAERADLIAAELNNQAATVAHAVTILEELRRVLVDDDHRSSLRERGGRR